MITLSRQRATGCSILNSIGNAPPWPACAIVSRTGKPNRARRLGQTAALRRIDMAEVRRTHHSQNGWRGDWRCWSRIAGVLTRRDPGSKENLRPLDIAGEGNCPGMNFGTVRDLARNPRPGGYNLCRARSNPGRARSIEPRGAVSDKRKYPLRPKPEPGTARMPSSIRPRTKAKSSGIGALGNM
jgi:hypothetical protein